MAAAKAQCTCTCTHGKSTVQQSRAASMGYHFLHQSGALFRLARRFSSYLYLLTICPDTKTFPVPSTA